MSNAEYLNGIFASPAYTVLTISLSVYTDLFLYGFVIILLPALLRDRCNTPAGQIQGQLSALLAIYNAVIIFATPMSSYISVRWRNKKKPFFVSLVALGGATLLFALAHDIATLVAARALQGISAAVVWTVGLGLLTDTVGNNAIGYAMGWVQFASSLGSVTGPLAGGILYTQVGHTGTFAVAVGLVGIDVLARAFVVEPPPATRTRSKSHDECDVAYRTPPNADAPSLAPGPEESTPLLRDDPRVTAQKSEPSVTHAGLAHFFKVLSTPEVLYHLMFSFTAMMLQTGYETIIPLHFQAKYGWSAQKTSLAFLPLILPVFFAPAVGTLHDRYGSAWFYVGGLTLFSISSPFMAVTRGAEAQDIALELTLLLGLGIAFVFLLTPAMAEVSSFGQRKEETDPGYFGSSGGSAQCCAVLNLSLAVGGVVGPLLAGSLMSVSGWSLTNVVLGAWPQLLLFCTGTALLTACVKSRKPNKV